MVKGKFGFLLSVYPILAFVFDVLRMPILAGVMVLLAVFIEKDQWAGRQSLQAFFLALLAAVLRDAGGLLMGWIPYYSVPVLSVMVTGLFTILYLVIIIFSVLGILRVMRGGEADIPGFSNLAYKAYGQVKPRPVPPFVPPYQQQGNYQENPGYQAYQQPPYPQQGTSAPQQTPSAPSAAEQQPPYQDQQQ